MNRYQQVRHKLGLVAFVVAGWGSCGVVPRAAASTAAAVYQETCAACHGADGQGVAGAYEAAFDGELSVDQLASLIERTMPDGSPEDCVGDEAREVAEYVYRQFYSIEARRRRGLAPSGRVEVLRLTAGQHRNVVADLIGQFTTPPPESPFPWPSRGLVASYFQSDGMNKATERTLTRIDEQVDFDFQAGAPVDGIAAEQFSIVWRGSLQAPCTGAYEFRLRTQNGARLYFNKEGLYDERILRDDSSGSVGDPLVDAWVGSGALRESSARVFLLGGRSYPLRLEFFKYMDATASICLEWKPPHGAWSVLGGDDLTTGFVSKTFVTEAPFPADDRSAGYERGSTVSGEWLDAATAAALDAADEIAERFPRLTGIDKGAGEFAARLAATAFRRPLSGDERRRFMELASGDPGGRDAGVRRAVLMALMSPSFLYTELTSDGAPATQHGVASRLALALWDSLPDEPLRAAADQGLLETREQIEAQVQRMLADPRAHAKVREFFAQWLELDERDLSKDRTLFPEFDEAVIADLRRSVELFVEHVVWSDASDYRELLLADYLFLNSRLRRLYDRAEVVAGDEPDASAASGGDFELVRFDPDQQSGVLTHPYLLSALAYHNNTSPIHRGVFLTRNIVGRQLRPPPVAVAFRESEFDPHLTMREKVTRLTSDSACMACHSVINPLGFSLEHFDAVGRWRESENDRAIDARSTYPADDGVAVEIANARDVARYAVQSDSAHRSFVRRLFRHMVKQDPTAYSPELLETLRREFAADEFNIRNLIVKVALVSARFELTPSDQEGSPQ
ncbi:MAG: DUF1592 domain-containing protein [Planctomycetales bacterium]|nr:DUF1592 domain-containing protein [Planctomycetales bacterium]